VKLRITNNQNHKKSNESLHEGTKESMKKWPGKIGLAYSF